MGKGDRRTAKGKRVKNSYGNSRPKGRKNQYTVKTEEAVVEATEE
jgi:ribosomal small subunit protein bTHX